jgi:hypothetical protein
MAVRPPRACPELTYSMRAPAYVAVVNSLWSDGVTVSHLLDIHQTPTLTE